MRPHDVYLVTFGKPGNLWSIVGEYAGQDSQGRYVFVCGTLTPIHVPVEEVVEWTCLT